jgi:hypothetical protein
MRLADPCVVVDGGPLACSARLAYGGAHQLSIWLTVPELADAAKGAVTVDAAELVEVA